MFLALLKREQHRPGELDYVLTQSQKFDIGAIGITTSAIALTEVFEARLEPEQMSQLRSMYSRSNFQFIDANTEICKVASEIKSFYRLNYKNSNDVPLFPSTQDAIHVASAIAAQRGLKQTLKLLTFDSDNKAKQNSLAMTKMSGMVANKYQLTICRPPVQTNEQLTLEGSVK